MTDQSHTQFYANLMGGFSLSFQGKVIYTDGRIQNKAMQVMLALLKAGSKGIPRKNLMRIIWYEEEDPQKRVGNLNQQIYLLRRLISEWSFPKGKYIVQKHSVYYFTLDYTVENDTESLDELIRQIRNATEEGELYKLLRAFCDAYKGEFLPMLNGEEWVTVESAYYHTQYFKCLSRLCDLLKEQSKYEEIVELCEKASRIYPYDEWQSVQMDCLIRMGRYKEAQKIYEKASGFFGDDLELTSISKVMDQYSNINSQLCCKDRELKRIKEELNEDDEMEREAYYCSCPGFADLYHIMARSSERSGRQSLLMLCTVQNSAQKQAEPSEDEFTEAEQQMEDFRRFLVKNIRYSDVYTRYSSNQFLVLLTEAEESCGMEIVRRLENGWKDNSRDTGIEIELKVQKVENLETQEYGDEGNGFIYSAYFKPGTIYLAGTDHMAG